MTDEPILKALEQIEREMESLIHFIAGLTTPRQAAVDWYGRLSSLQADRRVLQDFLRNHHGRPGIGRTNFDS